MVALAQPAADARLQAQLRQLFPSATSFSPREGQPPHFKAYVKDPASGQPAFAGLVFWTTDLQPLERGYYGPIKMLVGMDTKGILTGIIVVEHHEPYGNFSIDPPAFAAQFTNKNIRDALRVGDDINRRSEIADWLIGSGAGVHVRQDRAEELERVIRTLRDDQALCEGMGRAARSLFGERFGVERTAKQWIRILDVI